MRLLLLIATVLILAGSAAELRCQAPADSARITAYFDSAYAYCAIDLDSAYAYLDRVLEMTGKSGDCKNQLKAQFLKAECTTFHFKLQETADQLQRTESLIKPFRKDTGCFTEKMSLQLLALRGDYYMALGMFDRALAYFMEIENSVLRKKEKTEDDLNLLKFNALYIAFTYDKKGDLDNAIENFRQSAYYEQQLARLRQVKPETDYIFRYLGPIYQARGQYDSAQTYYNRYLRHLESRFKDTYSRKQLKTAYITSCHDLASLLRQRNLPDSAEMVLKHALAFHFPDDPFLSSTWYQLGLTMADKKAYKDAIRYLERSAVALRANFNGKKNYQSAQTCIALGDVYAMEGKWSNALEYYQQALINLVNDFNTPSVLENPRLSQAFAAKELLSALEKKSNALYRYALDNNRQEIYLESAMEAALRAADLIDSIRTDYSAEADKRFLLEKSYSVYALAIELAHQKGPAGARLAFDLSERSKAAILLEAVLSAQEEHALHLRADTAEQIMQLRHDIKNTRIQMDTVQNPAQLQDLNNKLNQLRRQYRILMASTEKNRPTRKSPVPDHADAKLRVILDEGQTLAAYFIDKDAAWLFVAAAGDSLTLVRIDWNSRWAEMAQSIGSDIATGNNAEYIRKARALYEHLVRPALSLAPNKNLLIIPDGVLWNVPFAALLTRDIPASKQKNFRDFPYLASDIAISYGFSLNMQSEMRRQLPPTAGRQILGFAPAYREGTKGYATQRGALNPLFHNRDELKEITGITGGRSLYGSAATKAAFLAALPQARILHIAAHAKANHQNPNFAFLAFDNTGDTLSEPYLLYAHELYYRTRPMEMVVFSACETGTGPVWRGEGVISLARAFAFGGAKSIVTTLWSIDDRASRDIMVLFYKNLKKGLSKDAALQQATLSYIETAPDQSRAHPRYWAAFTAIGNMEPVELGGFPWTGLLAGGLVLGVVLGVGWYLRKRVMRVR